MRRSIRTSWFPVVLVMLSLAGALLVVGLARGLVGPTAPSLTDGPGMACVQLADEGAFAAVEPGLSPMSADIRLDGRLRCVWPDGTPTTFHYVQLDAASTTMLWSSLVLTVGAAAHATISTSRRFAVYDR